PMAVAQLQSSVNLGKYLLKSSGKIPATSDLLFICTDYVHWAGQSGGAPTFARIEMPGADASIFDVEHDPDNLRPVTFVQYVRRCFKWAGFPGFDWYRDDNDKPGFHWGTPPHDLIRQLTEGLLPV